MHRSHTVPTSNEGLTAENNNNNNFVLTTPDSPTYTTTHDNTAALVHNIASFLTLSDAISLTPVRDEQHSNQNVAGVNNNNNNNSPADSWAVGEELAEDVDHTAEGCWTITSSSIPTPLTPALVAVSPGATPHCGQYCKVSSSKDYNDSDDEDDEEEEEERMQEILQERRKRWAQEKITAAVFSHPRPLRSFCWEAYTAANDIRTQKELEAIHIEYTDKEDDSPPETYVEPIINKQQQYAITTKKRSRRRRSLRAQIVHQIVDWILHNVPVSVLLDVLEGGGVVAFETTYASFSITISSLNHTIQALGELVVAVWGTITHCVTNPFQVLEAIISLQFNAMGKTSEVLVSGIQSVATGVGSASSMALYRLSATANMSASGASLAAYSQRNSAANMLAADNNKTGVLNQKLLRRLSSCNDAALVVDYHERGDDQCGLTRHAVSRTRRMMHYSVSLRPFVATVTLSAVNPQSSDDDSSGNSRERNNSPQNSVGDIEDQTDSISPSRSVEEENSPFMCTPQSFPTTPHSRQAVIHQRLRMSDDVVFLARDRLRVHDGLASDDVRTRERSQALESGKRLAIFALQEESGIELTCGRHIATKTGNVYYASARSMVGILRNCYVYFEFSVLPRPGIPLLKAVSSSLSIGMSTEEMPPNTLVGAWQGSVGLCTTGQILMAGQWCSPADPSMYAYGVGATVGCLVYLDDDSAMETWDGAMVKARIRFNVNGVMVSPPVSTLPVSGARSSPIRVGSPNSLASSSDSRQNAPTTGIQPTVQQILDSNPERTTLTLLVPAADDLYPTVTLQSSAISAACRFSSEDVIATTHEAIGAPSNVTVYGVDGSIIIHGKSNH